jgi:hypothetical protein
METAWMTVEQVAARYGIKRGYVYRLACLHPWQRRRDRDRRVRYRAADVDAVLGSRRVAKRPTPAQPAGSA